MTKDWIDSLISMGFTSTQMMLNKMLTLSVPAGASTPSKKQLASRLAYLKKKDRKEGNFAELGENLTPETLKAFATAELEKVGYTDDTARILSFQEDTTGSYYRCVEIATFSSLELISFSDSE
jgi:hypothetical protein